MVLASMVYLMVLWAPFRFWRSGVALAPSWLGGVVDGAGNASLEWLHGVGSQ